MLDNAEFWGLALCLALAFAAGFAFGFRSASIRIATAIDKYLSPSEQLSVERALERASSRPVR